MSEVAINSHQPGMIRAGITTGIAVAVTAAVIWVLASRNVTGKPLSGDLLTATQLTLDAYIELAKLSGLLGGGVAFLLTYRREGRVDLAGGAWTALAVGLGLIVGALVLAVAGIEIILQMVANEGIKLDLDALRFGRYALYLFLVGGALCIGWFAVLVIPRASNETGMHRKATCQADGNAS